ncbi:MAG: HNH endonuclease [Magnetococcales bacterium]|nr:HNH endonuclease [Magnetococcales bacterium]
MNLDSFFQGDPDQMERERKKAREMKRSPWWKNRIGNGVCTYCTERFHPKELTLDHVVPLVKGGRTSKSNCVPACHQCNQDKRHMAAGEWKALLEKRGLLE